MTSPQTKDLPILTVTQLTNAIKISLESTFPQVWLQGEVSNSKLHSSGHFYFSLKDANAQIAAVMFRPEASKLKSLPKDGAQVMVKGEINVYPSAGKYQILVHEMKLMGLGELLLKLEELKIKLHKRGWFKSDRKKPLPKLPKIIGVVTSPTGAAIQDILNILTRRFSGFKLLLNPVRVQGEGAAQEIARAINEFNQYNLVDVMIVGRGGGSIEDLWAFNEEIVAEAIYNSHIPIISAVGHETDHCIADYVADVRAPTPSAAAEIVIAEKARELHHLSQIEQRLKQTMKHLFRHHRHQIEGISRHPIFQTSYAILGPWMQRLDDLRQTFDQSIAQKLQQKKMLIEGTRRALQSLKPSAKINHFRQKLYYWDKSIRAACLQRLQIFKKSLLEKKANLNLRWKVKQESCHQLFSKIDKQQELNDIWLRNFNLRKERLQKIAANLHSLNPKNLLAKGYSILFSEKDGSVIVSVQNVMEDEDVRITIADGDILAKIKEIRSK